jgi:hypothetical protein
MFPCTRVSVLSLFVVLALPNLELRLRSFVLRVHKFFSLNFGEFWADQTTSAMYIRSIFIFKPKFKSVLVH